MQILGICGSPRKGNTEWMLTTVLDAATDGGADYMGLLSGLLKSFLDRTCPIWPALRGKGIADAAALAKLPKDACRQPALRRRLERLGRQLALATGLGAS
jgi:multimeric flavodoxin WrbA